MKSLVGFLVLSVTALALGSQEVAIRRVIQHLIAADNARDLSQAVSLYASDAILLPPGLPAIAGENAIRERYRGLYANAIPKLTQEIAEVIVRQDWAYVRGRTFGLFPRGPGEPALEIDDKFIMTMKRVDGRWLITRLMWNSSLSPK